MEQENRLLLAGPGEKYKKATNTQAEKRFTSMCTALRLVEYLEFYIISNNRRTSWCWPPGVIILIAKSSMFLHPVHILPIFFGVLIKNCHKLQIV